MTASPAPAPKPRAPRQSRPATAPNPRQLVFDRLGDGPAAAGTAVVQFVEDALSANREQVTRLVSEHNDNVQAFQARVAEFVSRDEFESVRSDVERIKAGFIRTAAELTGAVTAHNAAATTPSPTTLEEARAAVARAAQATQTDAQNLGSLESRVRALELLVQEHERLLSNLGTPLSIALPTTPPPAGGSSAPAAPATGATRVRRFISDANPRGWGWLAWVLAIVGLIMGLMVGLLLTSLSLPVLQVLAWLALPIFGFLGFFAGGVIGYRITPWVAGEHVDTEVTTVEETQVQA